METYSDSYGDVLDMAFVDRGALWDRLRSSSRGEIQVLGPGKRFGTCQFGFEGCADDLCGTWPEPGHQVPLTDEEIECIEEHPEYDDDDDDDLESDYPNPYDSDESDIDPKDPYCIGRGAYKYKRSVERMGPDGQGPDRRIRNARDFRDAVTEIIGRLSQLETFRWDCPVTPIPHPVFASLKSMPNLTAFHLNMYADRMAIHDLPLWELTPKLRSLSFTNVQFATLGPSRNIAPNQEVTEEELTSFEIPAEREAFGHEEREQLHYDIVFRTVVAAAKTGRLRELELPKNVLYEPFAVRKLLPCWVGVEVFGLVRPKTEPAFEQWIGAAASLRPALAHASLWAPNSDPGARQTPSLTGADIQAVCTAFANEGVPRLRHSVFNPREAPHSPFKLYMGWLLRDAALAQKVADAWNIVVERGEADVVQCVCSRCQARDQALRPEAYISINFPFPRFDAAGNVTSIDVQAFPTPRWPTTEPNYGTGGFPTGA